jgi:hypothetical protein
LWQHQLWQHIVPVQSRIIQSADPQFRSWTKRTRDQYVASVLRCPCWSPRAAPRRDAADSTGPASQGISEKRPGRQKNSNPQRFPEPPHARVRLTKWVRQEGKMLTLTVLKSVVLVAGLVAASMFLQAAMTYGKLPLVIGQ